MQKDQNFHRKAKENHFMDEMGDRNMHIRYDSSAFDAVFPPCAKLRPFNGVELEPSTVCPKNFIVLDQTHDRSQVMYHPDMTRKLNSPALNAFASSFQNEHAREWFSNYEQEASSSSSHKEDSDEIDALLSCDDDEEEEEEDEEYDTGEVYTESPCSGYGWKESGNSSCNSGEKRREKTKKMMKMLRRIVPGGEQMDTASVLDEAVQYLKSLELDAQKKKLGNGNFKIKP
ncbi:PREDICTED: transcription factor bHLH144-like [Tarenaya hassleriana]|uniref:transcription factor bHLH144-like n=1 Tax=Tarenaya hassleriana TaxID=28532 RepID=UPI00053C368F|nr:PREDICTED: transcription factor bHLH144-like [Tarenaya hassleriana]XP_010540554.2 PREDICTED: transcription factor bHLH144-like [Tarenaya hassleriana]